MKGKLTDKNAPYWFPITDNNNNHFTKCLNR